MSIQRTRLPHILVCAVAALLLPAAITCASETAPAVGPVAIDPSTPSTIYAGTNAGVFKTTDAGEHWTAIAPALYDVHALVIDPSAPSTLYAAVSSKGVFRSTDGGSTWSPIGVSYWWVTTLAIDPQNGTLYATVAEFGVFRWDAHEEQWTQIFAVQWLPGEFAWTYSIAVHTPAMYLGVFYGTWDVAATAVYSSFDGGGSWNGTELNTYPPTDAVPVNALAIDPANPWIVYAAVSADGLFKSTDGGASWSRTDIGGGAHSVVIDPSHSSTLYAALTFGVMKSGDGGITWTRADAGLTETLIAFGVGSSVGGLAIDPQTPDTLYAGTAIGVFKTTDGGSHWAPSGLVQQAPLATLSIASSSVISGDVAMATVTLAASQTSDVSIALSSSDVTLATVPSNVTVQAGSTMATFAISTNPVFTSTNVFIRASLGDATKYASLLLQARTSVRNVLVDPSVLGGNRAVGTVYLTRAPGSTEAVEVALASSNPIVASVPASVTIPADGASAAFTINTTAVNTATTVSISATYQTTAAAVITVNSSPALLASLTLHPLTIDAGTSSAATVTLTAGAPAGGASISLSSVQQPAGIAALPSSVTVPQGATSAVFIVTTFKCSPGSATISAAYAGMMKSASLTATTKPDVVAIQRARYQMRRHTLTLEVTSTDWNATLDAYLWSGGQVGSHIGTLTRLLGGSYGGQFSWPVYPTAIVVTSSSCGSATGTVKSVE
jgi:photosystem II stability/assembly factor-like uncharacterized protein